MSWHIDNKGLRLADTSEILKEVQEAFKSIWADLNIDPSTPQGQLITVITDSINRGQQAMAELANVFMQGGRGAFLDIRNQSLYGVSRKPATQAMARVRLRGVGGVIVPAGFAVSDSEKGELWETEAEDSIGEDGYLTVSVYAKAGKLSAAEHTLTFIRTPTEGVYACDNTEPSTEGLEAESDTDYFARAESSRHFRSLCMFESGLAQVRQIEGVLKASGEENTASTAITVKGVSLAPHSVAYIVEGGNDIDIARTILRTKNPGCKLNGNTTLEISGTNTEKKYSISFYRPTYRDIYVSIQIQKQLSDNAEYLEVLHPILSDYIEGLDFGETIYPAQMLNRMAETGYIVADFKIGKSKTSTGYTALTYNLTDRPRLQKANISVEVINAG